jgi:hypothetical protein
MYITCTHLNAIFCHWVNTKNNDGVYVYFDKRDTKRLKRLVDERTPFGEVSNLTSRDKDIDICELSRPRFGPVGGT